VLGYLANLERPTLRSTDDRHHRPGLWAHRRRLTATLLAVGLGVAFLAGTLLLSDTLRANFDRLFTQADAGTDVVLRSATEVSPGPAASGPASTPACCRWCGRARCRRRPALLEGYGQLVGRDGQPIGGGGPPTQAANWVGDAALNSYRLVAGHAPRSDDEVVINRAASPPGTWPRRHDHAAHPQPLRVHIVGIATFGTAGAYAPPPSPG